MQALTEEQTERLKKLQPIRIILRIDEGKVKGLVENSWSMDWLQHVVNIFWSGPAYSMLGEHQLDGVKWAKDNHKPHQLNEFVFDPFAPDCPVEIDWDTWLNATTKFDKRNAPFTTKVEGAYMLRALAAERELEMTKQWYKDACAARDEADDKLEKIKQIVSPPYDDDIPGEDN